MNSSGKDLDQLIEIADLEFTSTEMDDCEVTIQQWLRELLCRVWIEKDEFSGKSAFGNSGWEYDLYRVLIRENIITGTIDKYGDIDPSEAERNCADNIILDIIVEVM